MAKSTSTLFVENENLFRAFVCMPVAMLFIMLSVNASVNAGSALFLVLYIVLAVYFSVNVLSYAAHYTNERFSGQAQPLISNVNLSKAIKFTPLALLFSFIAYSAVMSSAHLFFKLTFVLLAVTCVLAALAYAAFYTNDYYEKQSAH